MSPFAVASEPPAATIRVQPTPHSLSLVRSAQLEPVVRFDSSPWLPSVLWELRSLEKSGQNIPGVGDLRVTRSTADHVRRLLTIASGVYLPEPTLAPFSGGGVALTWNIGNRELAFTAYPDHNDFVFMRTDEDGEPVDDGILRLDQAKELGDVVTAFLATPVR